MTNTAVDTREQKSLPELVAASKDELRRLLPDYDRFARILTTEVRRTPKLAQCSPESFLAAAFLCAQLGLEPGPLADAWLIPRNVKGPDGRRRLECTFLLGYKGIEKLAIRSGQISSIETRTVYEGDEFEVEYFPEQVVRHVPAFRPGAKPKLWYAVARRADGSNLVHVLDREQVEARRKCSSSPDKGPWVDHYDAMARKSVIRAMWQNLPLEARDPTVDRALAADEQTLDATAIRALPEATPHDDESTGEIIDVAPESDDQDTQEGGRAETRRDTEGDATTGGDGPGSHDVGRASGEPGPRTTTAEGQPAAPTVSEGAPDADPTPPGTGGDGTVDGPSRPATEKQIRAVHVLLGKSGLTDDEYRRELDHRYGAGSSKDLTADQASDLIAWLQPDQSAGGDA